MLRLYGIITAIIGLDEVVYNSLFIGKSVEPFRTPSWVIIFELAWTLISVDVLVRSRRRGQRPMLPATYILYTAFAVFYAYHLGTTHGSVTPNMLPEWWKIVSLGAGAWFVSGGVALARNPE